MSAVRDYVLAAAACVRAEDGPRLALLLELDTSRAPGGGALPAALLGVDIGAAVVSHFPGAAARPWQALLSSHLSAIAELARGRVEAAFDAEHAALGDMVQLVNDCTTNWQIRPLHALVRGARRLSIRLEAELAARGAREAATGKIVRPAAGATH